MKLENPPLRSEIERRLSVLQEWKANGIPPEYVLPQSLTEARQWNVPKLGIQPIASPNSFTKGHPEHGKLVSKIAELLTFLNNKYEGAVSGVTRPTVRDQVKAEKTGKLKDMLASAEDQLTMVAGQWYAERKVAQTVKRDLTDAKLELASLHERLAEKDTEIADLKRRLMPSERLRVIE
ncbi:hypothetical protein [Tardiphaga robiniae]|uniref:Uncharacterized protein n=1 Tax=Tardiphaga robiniae TaxID=943830 RepID=A0A7G6TTX9_9BRAD|nr:hypothetical protein [Tardiphaga robiniae]QND70211.1 hypothetical protein HB776_02375 [Tardiphaga robiniae]